MKLATLSLGLLLSVLCTAGCVSTNNQTHPVTVVAKQSPDYAATKWYRDSSERAAIDREVFYFASQVIKHKVATDKLKPHQWGVILDVDDTILDNSYYDYQNILQNKKFNPKTYANFVNTESAIATPGAKAFLMMVHRRGGYVNLVTNRSSAFQQVTEENLRKQGLYFDQLIVDTKQKSSVMTGKNARFAAVENGYAPSHLPKQKIIAWVGDNIQDFPLIKQSDMILQNPDGKSFQFFGVSYFVLPNPMYGSWTKNKFK